mgnify:CR=1 FL=1
MKSNFDFLKNIDKELFSDIEDAQKLFRDEYFNQSMVQIRIFAEKMAKKILNSSENLTFDDTLNCLKDKIKTEREKEFIDDLFFIKKEGNKCAHGEDTTAIAVLEVLKRSFEAAINYSYAKKKDEKIDKLQFDETLLITGKPLKENTLVEKYVELAQKEKEELLNSKQNEFNSQVEKKQDGFKDESFVNNPKKYKSKKQLSPEKQKIKDKVKQAKKNLKQNINKTDTKQLNKNLKKQIKNKKQQKNNFKKIILFAIFVIISLFFLIITIFPF